MGRKIAKAKQIRAYVAKNPDAKPKEIGLALGIPNGYVSTVMWSAKRQTNLVDKVKEEHLKNINKTLEKWRSLAIGISDTPLVTDSETGIEPNRMSELSYNISMGRAKARMESSQDYRLDLLEPEHDPVNHPSHYKVGGIETIDFIEAKKLNYNLGNVVKYLTRAEHKDNRKQDLEKARWYLTREIDSLT